MMLAADGRCKFGDTRADGIVRSDGVGFVVLKRLRTALVEGDDIYAVIKGSAVNNNGGRSDDMFTPSVAAQEALLRAAYQHAGVSPTSVQYVEAHGTGTRRGDPIELTALGSVIGSNRARPCMVGSVKSNIGHTEAAAGVAGLIKVVLAIREGVIPPSLHVQQPLPTLFDTARQLTIPTVPTIWAEEGGARLAGVSALGFTGTNVHVVIEGRS
jgi:acyl transferase domain-containing protein